MNEFLKYILRSGVFLLLRACGDHLQQIIFLSPHYYISLSHSKQGNIIISKRTSQQPKGTRLTTDGPALDGGINFVKGFFFGINGQPDDAHHIHMHISYSIKLPNSQDK